MFAYYLSLALKSLRRNVVLTALMIAAIGVGIGASMTTLTVFRAMAGDPIPEKSSILFTPQIQNRDPSKQLGVTTSDRLPDQLSYIDAVNLMNAHGARRQVATYSTSAAVTPANPQLQPFQVSARATYADFFPMFETPFLFGSGWRESDDAGHADVVVITRSLNDKLFGGQNSVGRTVNLDNRDYRVVGVLDRWSPLPKFYDLISSSKFGKAEDVYLPFTHAIDAHQPVQGALSCSGDVGAGWDGMLNSSCVWTQFWVELPTPADAAAYRRFLDNYAKDQNKSGRFRWTPRTELRDVKQWLVYEHVVSDEVRILVLVSFSFLFVCLLNAMGLLLAKIMVRSGEIGVRRALGATRRAIVMQCLVEAGTVGLAGGLLGLLLTALGLWGLRSLLSEQIAELSRLNSADVGIAIVLAIVAAVMAGLYPTWRATQLQPAWQLKSF